MKLAVAGDIILMRTLPSVNDKLSRELIEYLSVADFRTANMEMCLTRGEHFASSFCGGTWLTADPSILNELELYGFDHYSFANNHAMDYSYGGFCSTLEAFQAKGLKSSGAGLDLESASQHALLTSEKEHVALISVTTTCHDSARAGETGGSFPPRPGVNMLRHEALYYVNSGKMEALKELARATHINGRRDHSIRGGYTHNEAGVFNFGGIRFQENPEEGKATIPNKRDCLRIKAAIREALVETDYLVIICHSHEIKGIRDDEPDYFLESFSRLCIDWGASAVVCSGTHQIKGIEVYRGAPIFYSIGNFIYQSDQVDLLPYDFYEKYQIPEHFTSQEALAVRSAGGTRGLQTDVHNYLALLPTLTFEKRRVKKVEILPLDLSFRADQRIKGLPRQAQGKALEMIVDTLERLNRPYGTRFEVVDGLIVIEC